MQLSIASIREQRGALLPFDFMVPPADLKGFGPEARPVGSVRVRGQVTNTGDSMLVEGQAQGEFAMTCARCLRPMRAPVTAEFQERFRRQGARPVDRAADRRPETGPELGDPPVSLDDDQDDARSYHGDWLNLDEAVREALLLHMPMKPVCAPDCRGLCPQCGTNLNEAACGCEPETVDPRLAVLREWGKPPPEAD